MLGIIYLNSPLAYSERASSFTIHTFGLVGCPKAQTSCKSEPITLPKIAAFPLCNELNKTLILWLTPGNETCGGL